MYVTLEEFEQNVHKYMMLAKRMDLHIVDATQKVVWTLHCRKDSLLANLVKTIREALGDEYDTIPTRGGYLSDLPEPACLGPCRLRVINMASHESGWPRSIGHPEAAA